MYPSNFTPHLVSLVSSIVMGNYYNSPQQHYTLSSLSPAANYLSRSLLCSELPPIHLYPSAAELTKWNSLFSKNSITKEQKDNIPLRLWFHGFCTPSQSVDFLLLDSIAKIKSAFLPTTPLSFLQQIFQDLSYSLRVCFRHSLLR